MIEIAFYKAILVCKDRAERLAELVFPIDEAKKAGMSADELLGYISTIFTASAVQAQVMDVKAIICFMYDDYGAADLQSGLQEPGSTSDGPGFEPGEIRTRDVCCQTDDLTQQTASARRQSVHEEADQFLSNLFRSDQVNVSTPLLQPNPLVRGAKKSKEQKRLKRRMKKVTSASLQAELGEFAREHHKILYLALDRLNVAWLNHNSSMHCNVLREALLLYQHRMYRETITYPQKLLNYFFHRVARV